MNLFATIRKIIAHLELLPYSIKYNPDAEFKKLWLKSLFSFSTRYTPLFLISKVTWPVMVFFKLRKGKMYRLLNLKENNILKKQLWDISLKNEVHPKYYIFYGKENFRERIGAYLLDNSVRHCFAYIARNIDNSPLKKKSKFYEFCLRNDIPTAEIYAHCQKGRFSKEKIIPWEQEVDFIIKPDVGFAGAGIDRFVFKNKSSLYLQYSTNTKIPQSEISSVIKNITRQNGKLYLLQERLLSHSIFSELGNNSISTIRIISITNEHKQIEIFRPMLHIPQGESLLNYLHNKSILCHIDLNTGVIGKGISVKNLDHRFLKHPDTGAFIEGVQLPFWEDVASLVRKAHSKLSYIPLIAWDIGLTPEGPKFLEGNCQPSIDNHQLAPQSPFCGSRFYELFKYHLSN